MQAGQCGLAGLAEGFRALCDRAISAHFYSSRALAQEASDLLDHGNTLLQVGATGCLALTGRMYSCTAVCKPLKTCAPVTTASRPAAPPGPGLTPLTSVRAGPRAWGAAAAAGGPATAARRARPAGRGLLPAGRPVPAAARAVSRC